MTITTKILTLAIKQASDILTPLIDPLGENKTGPVTPQEVWGTRYKQMMARRQEPVTTMKPTTHFSPTATWTDTPIAKK